MILARLTLARTRVNATFYRAMRKRSRANSRGEVPGIAPDGAFPLSWAIFPPRPFTSFRASPVGVGYVLSSRRDFEKQSVHPHPTSGCRLTLKCARSIPKNVGWIGLYETCAMTVL